jgi:hypothetical protein
MKTKSVFLLSFLFSMCSYFGCEDQIQPDVGAAIGAAICGPPCIEAGAFGGGLYGLAAGISDQFL